MTKTISPEIAQQNRSYKLLLIVAMVSMTMMFAGITSAFFVSKSRVDWMKDFVMPTPFFISTICIVLVSVCFFLAKKAIKNDNQKSTSIFLLGALILGIAFVIFQFKGFEFVVGKLKTARAIALPNRASEHCGNNPIPKSFDIHLHSCPPSSWR